MAAVGATIPLLSFEQELAILVRVLVHHRGHGGLQSYCSPTILRVVRIVRDTRHLTFWCEVVAILGHNLIPVPVPPVVIHADTQHSRRSRLRSPVVIRTGTQRSRGSRSHSPIVIRTGTQRSRRSRSRSSSRSPIVVRTDTRRSGRSRSRSHSPVHRTGTYRSRLSRSRTPPPVILQSSHPAYFASYYSSN